MSMTLKSPSPSFSPTQLKKKKQKRKKKDKKGNRKTQSYKQKLVGRLYQRGAFVPYIFKLKAAHLSGHFES